MLQVTPIVFVVDDEVSVRESLELLIQCEGWQPETLAPAQKFLDSPGTHILNCLVLDVSLPGLNGLDLQQFVASDRTNPPVRSDRTQAHRAAWDRPYDHEWEG